MNILSDRRTLREIGGFRAYLTQVGWSLWWRSRSVSDRSRTSLEAAQLLTAAPKRAVPAPAPSRASTPPTA